jgi:hypothetical protein
VDARRSPPAVGAAGPGATSTSPLALRLRRPSWLDPRLAVGVLLVLVSVLVGVQVVAAADRTDPVWAVRSDLAAGTTLAPGDLVVVRMRLSTGANRYLAAGRSPAGLLLVRDVRAGELLPRDSVGPHIHGSLVSIPVSPQHVPSTIRAGQRIDVYATTKGPNGPPQTARVLAAVPVQQVRYPARGVMSSTAEVAIVVRVPAESAVALVRALRSADIDVTVVSTTRSRP